HLVLADAEGRAGHGVLYAEGIALPHPAGGVALGVLPLLAREPRAPRREPARAVAEGAVEDPVGVHDRTVSGEADRTGPTGQRNVEIGQGGHDVGEKPGAA